MELFGASLSRLDFFNGSFTAAVFDELGKTPALKHELMIVRRWSEALVKKRLQKSRQVKTRGWFALIYYWMEFNGRNWSKFTTCRLLVTTVRYNTSSYGLKHLPFWRALRCKERAKEWGYLVRYQDVDPAGFLPVDLGDLLWTDVIQQGDLLWQIQQRQFIQVQGVVDYREEKGTCSAANLVSNVGGKKIEWHEWQSVLGMRPWT